MGTVTDCCSVVSAPDNWFCSKSRNVCIYIEIKRSNTRTQTQDYLGCVAVKQGLLHQLYTLIMQGWLATNN